MAGVAAGTFADNSRAVMGSRHRKRVRPDREWLVESLRQRHLELGLRNIEHVSVLLNNMCLVRGDRLVIPVAAGAERVVHRVIRNTPAVQEVLKETGDPLPVGELHDRLCERFPQAPGDRMWELLERLVEFDVLLTDSASWPEGEESHRGAFESYEACPVGDGYATLSELYRITGSTSSVHVDLALDATVRLPRIVAREAEQAASVLWRMSDPSTQAERALRAYHVEFLERYSQGELVPVKKLLDPDLGLGAPAGYTLPDSHRQVPPVPPVAAERVELLGRLVMEATRSGRRHVDLDADMVAALSHREGHAPESVELFASLNAASVQGIERGDFELVVMPIAATQRAGSSWGRFADLLGVVDELWDRTVDDGIPDGHPLPVQLMYATPYRRGSNLASVPRISEHRLAVGTHDGLARPCDIRLDDVVVSADAQGFHLHDLRLGREIAPFVPHLLNRSFAPNVARFLSEAPELGQRPLSRWSWGPFSTLPFLPALRYGRTQLSPATWRLRPEDLASGDGGAALRPWRERWNVPDRVRLGNADRYVSLDLATEAHCRLLCGEAVKDACVLHEDRSPDPDTGWLRGPDGVHEAEIVVSLRSSAPRVRESRLPAPIRQNETPVHHTPGGSWLSAHLYCSLFAQHEVLGRMSAWIQERGPLVGTWFFIRYSEPGSGRSLLRLRIRGDSDDSNRRILEEFHVWGGELRAAGLVSDLSLHTYRAEAERYGGVPLMPLAEEFFRADSSLVLSRLRGGDDALDVADDVLALIRIFHAAGNTDWEEWVLTCFSKRTELHAHFVARRREALARVRGDGIPGGAEGGRGDWSLKLREYATAVWREASQEAWLDPAAVLRALVHMHCNRRLKPAPDAEQRIYALIRGVVEARVNRRRSKREA